MRAILSIAVLSFLSACATQPVYTADRKHIAAERHLAFQEKTEKNNAALEVTRDKGHTGSYCYMGFYIDDQLAARMDTAEKATFYVEPGEHVLRYGAEPSGRGLCVGSKNHWTQTETTLQPNEKKDFRLTIDANGQPIIQRNRNF